MLLFPLAIEKEPQLHRRSKARNEFVYVYVRRCSRRVSRSSNGSQSDDARNIIALRSDRYFDVDIMQSRHATRASAIYQAR